jgi:hypothetical protein
MKIRNGFVSNSSSSSFIVIPRNGVETAFLRTAREAYANKHDMEPDEVGWWIKEQPTGHFSFNTTIDNEDMHGFLEALGFQIEEYE